MLQLLAQQAGLRFEQVAFALAYWDFLILLTLTIIRPQTTSVRNLSLMAAALVHGDVRRQWALMHAPSLHCDISELFAPCLNLGGPPMVVRKQASAKLKVRLLKLLLLFIERSVSELGVVSS